MSPKALLLFEDKPALQSFSLTPRPPQGLGKASQRSFTLIELLVVIAILTVLAIAVVLVLNPVELLKESRDTTRIEDLATISKALNLLQTDQTNAFFGTSTIVYISIPDTTTTCANLGLPSLPSPYTYGCAPTSTYRKADGTGWIPVDFTSLSFGSPLAKLPIDPINTTSSGLYYTYVPGGSWELTALMESTKRRLGGDKDVTSTDGGDTWSVYEVGSNLTRNPVNDSGLVGYWKLDEGSGTFADSSGSGNTGTQSGGVSYGQAGKVGKAVGFDGGDDWVQLGAYPAGTTVTVSAWIKTTVGGWYVVGAHPTINHLWFIGNKLGTNFATFRYENVTERIIDGATTNIKDGQWHHILGMTTPTYGYLYVDGVLENSLNVGGNWAGSSSFRIGNNVALYFNGSIDDVRIYNRALSNAEIQAIYNATR